MRRDSRDYPSGTSTWTKCATCLVVALVLAGCGDGAVGPVAGPADNDSAARRVNRGPGAPRNWVITQDYGGFSLTYDCTLGVPIRYEYTLSFDTGSEPRPSSFRLDPMLPVGCRQQLTANSYASVVAGWDRGHLVTSNHMDYSSDYIRAANYMTNIVPQVSTFNQG